MKVDIPKQSKSLSKSLVDNQGPESAPVNDFSAHMYHCIPYLLFIVFKII